MTTYPHSRIFVGPTRTVDIAGPHIQVLDTVTGAVLHSTASSAFPEEQKSAVLKSGVVRCAAVDREFRYLVTSGEDKMLKVWEIEGLKLVNERELPKKPTSVLFTADAQTILVSDKFGDVFSYPFTYVPLTVKQQRDALSSHENPSGGQLILGHASPLNAFLLTPDDEKYIITADRDEHIRVSWFPKGYNIEMYCLGHLQFVSALHIPPSTPSLLISGGGDPMLKVWDWMTGVVRHEVRVLETVEPYMAVRAVRRKRGSLDADDGEEGEAKAKGKRKRGRGKGKQKEEEGDEIMAEASENAEDLAEPEKVLVIHRIEGVDSDAGPHIVFSAVGATALFAFPYKLDVVADEIRCVDFKRPVIEFEVVDGKTIIVSLDGGEEASTVQVVRLSGGLFTEDEDTLKTLVGSLNSTSLLAATPDELQRLDLYSALTSMPKYKSDEDGDNLLPVGAPELSASETVKKGKRVELNKKELARIKGKERVMEQEERDAKKARSIT